MLFREKAKIRDFSFHSPSQAYQEQTWSSGAWVMRTFSILSKHQDKTQCKTTSVYNMCFSSVVLKLGHICQQTFLSRGFLENHFPDAVVQ
jgi:hypothetical protein